MNRIDVLITSVTLLYRSRLIDKNDTTSNSKIVKNILSLGKKKKPMALDGAIESPEEDLTSLIKRMLESPDIYEDKSLLLSELKVLLKSSKVYYETIKDQINAELTEPGIKRSLTSMRAKLSKHYQSLQALALVNKLSFNLNNNRIEKSIQEDILYMLPELEALCKKSDIENPGLVNTMVLSSSDDIDIMLNKLKSEKSGESILKTGWKALNTCLQGGFRLGETATINALQYSYKSGFSQSIFMQIPRYNKPILKDPKKKPAIMYISLEDELHNVLKFMYKYLYINENKKLPDNTENDISLMSSDSVKEYIMSRLGVNGHELILLRGDPGKWTYHDIINIIQEYQGKGYDIQVCLIDYLSKLPTTGCDNSGAMGTGIRDLFNRMRNFFSSAEGGRGIFFLTPHQLSAKAKDLTKNGIDPAYFVKEVANKGYTEGSSQIDQVLDLDLYVNKAKINGRYMLTVQRGKHRGQDVIPDEQMYFTLPFPNQGPILEDVNNSASSSELTTDTLESLESSDDLF